MKFCLKGVRAWAGLALVAAGPAWAELITFAADGERLVPQALTEQPAAYQVFAKAQPADQPFTVDTAGYTPMFPTSRMSCRVDSYEPKCFAVEDQNLPVCSQFEGLEHRFVKVSSFKSGYGETWAERGIPSKWDKLSVGEKAAVAAGAPLVALVFAPTVAVYAVVKAISSPGCVGIKTKWVEFDHDAFAKATKAAWEESGLVTQIPASTALMHRLQETRDALQATNQSAWEAARASTSALTKAKPQPFVTGAVLAQLPTFISVPLNAPGDDFETQSVAAAKQQAADNLAAAQAQLATDLRVWRERHISAQRQAFAAATTSAALKSLLASFGPTCEPELLAQATKRAEELAKAEERVAAQRSEQLARERAAADAEARIDRENMRRTLAKFRGQLRTGVETNCGPVVELKPPLALVAAPVQGYGNTHWLRIAELFLPGQSCRFVNGNYVGL